MRAAYLSYKVVVPEQALAVRVLLAHRLSGESAEAAKADWYEVVEGDHALWKGVSEPYKHTIRAFLVYFHTQILRHSTERFNFRNGSVGGLPSPSLLPSHIVVEHWWCAAVIAPASLCAHCECTTHPLPMPGSICHGWWKNYSPQTARNILQGGQNKQSFLAVPQ